MTLNFTDALAIAKHATTRQGVLWCDLTGHDQASALEFVSHALEKAIDLGIVILPAPTSDITSGADIPKTPHNPAS